MNRVHAMARWALWLGFVLLVAGVPATSALAAEGDAGWRPTYDLVMKWVNFAILAGVLIKFGRTPVSNFLRGHKIQIQLEIERLEKARDEAVLKLGESAKLLDESHDRFVQMTERIVSEGERRRREIVEFARNESQILLEGARRKIDNRILRAQDRIRAELVDAAIELALERLPGAITDEDDRRLSERFVHYLGT